MARIKEIKSNHTEKKLYKEFPWLEDADIENAVVGVEDGILVWHDGAWKGGAWKGGVWKGGVWHNGEWERGIWNNGAWNNGVWRDGAWYDGHWYGGVWELGWWIKGYIKNKFSLIAPYYNDAAPTININVESQILENESSAVKEWLEEINKRDFVINVDSIKCTAKQESCILCYCYTKIYIVKDLVDDMIYNTFLQIEHANVPETIRLTISYNACNYIQELCREAVDSFIEQKNLRINKQIWKEHKKTCE